MLVGESKAPHRRSSRVAANAKYKHTNNNESIINKT